MVKVGDKYIIEIGEKYITNMSDDCYCLDEYHCLTEEQVNAPVCLYRIKGFNTLTFDEKELNKLEVFKNPTEEATYQQILDKVQHAINLIVLPAAAGGLNFRELETIFALDGKLVVSWWGDIFKEYTIDKIIDKLAKYENKPIEETEAENMSVDQALEELQGHISLDDQDTQDALDVIRKALAKEK